MKPHVRWIVVLALLSLMSACFMMRRTVSVNPDNKFRRAAAVKTRWIGLARTASCPASDAASGWTESSLFPLDGLEPDLRESARKAGLDRFCVYEYYGRAPCPKLPREISERLLSVETDKVAMTSSAAPGALAEMIWSPFHERFSHYVETPESLPAFTGSPTRLAVLDTQADGSDVPHRTPEKPEYPDHGSTLMHIAADLACKSHGVPCAVRIASRLAMPVVGFDPVQGKEVTDTVHGGFRGTYAYLSQAIWNEIRQQNKIKQQHRTEHLVLNLSLGWDGEKFGGLNEDPADMPPGVQAVYRALEVASDQGILVIAAAGNELSGLDSTNKPLLPAGWESLRRPAENGPLVYAVSGIDG
jgi:hypothetical protein